MSNHNEYQCLFPYFSNFLGSDAESGGYHELVCHTPPPTYESAYPSSEYPPDYRDALQDVIVNDSYLPYSTRASNYAPPVQGETASSSDVQTDSVVTPATGEHESPVPTTTSPESASNNSACDFRSHSCECPPYESISTNDFASCPSSNDASPTATVQALSMPTPPELDADTEADSSNVVTPANSACTEHWTGDLSQGRVSRCSFYQSKETTSSPVATRACTGSDLEDRVDIAVQCQETQSLISAGREEH